MMRRDKGCLGVSFRSLFGTSQGKYKIGPEVYEIPLFTSQARLRDGGPTDDQDTRLVATWHRQKRLRDAKTATNLIVQGVCHVKLHPFSCTERCSNDMFGCVRNGADRR